jgi:hypothetical protein
MVPIWRAQADNRQRGANLKNVASSVVLVAMTLAGAACAAQQRHHVDPETGIETWELQTSGVTLSLTQILSDQARAFYVNRGFPVAVIDPYATACVFMTVLRNDAAPGSVHFRQADWSVITSQGTHPPVGAQEWLRGFERGDLPRSALIAFRWAQFPVEHTYEPGGDWNQGMLTTGLSAGAVFDLAARWDVAGIGYEGVLKNVRCSQ